MKRISYAIFALLLSSSSAYGEQVQEISFATVLKQVGQSAGLQTLQQHIDARTQRSFGLEARFFGDTSAEIETRFDYKGKSTKAYSFTAIQPLQFGGRSASLKEAFESEAAAAGFENQETVLATAYELAVLLAEVEELRERKDILNIIHSFYQRLSKDAQAGLSRGQTYPLVTKQISEKLRRAHDEGKQIDAAISELEGVLSVWGFSPGTTLRIEGEYLDQEDMIKKVVALPAVAKHAELANAAGARARHLSARFDMDLGIGVDVGSDDRDTSYLIKLGVPIGQVYSRKQEASVQRIEKSVQEQQGILREKALEQKIRVLFSRLHREQNALQSAMASVIVADSIFQLARQGFERGLIGFLELKDAFDSLVELKYASVEAHRNIHSIELELLSYGGAK